MFSFTGQTALHLAIRKGLAAVVPAFEASETARSCRDDDGDCPIHTAFKCGLGAEETVAVARALLQVDSSQANVMDFNDAAALNIVSRAGRSGEEWQCRCAQLLLDYQALVGQVLSTSLFSILLLAPEAGAGVYNCPEPCAFLESTLARFPISI